MLDWVIVGGGPHGLHLAHRLRAGRGVPADRLAVLDPHPEPLSVWDRCVTGCGMTHLRSPAVHHLDLDPWALVQHARAHGFDESHLAAPYQRPSVALFCHHVRHLVERRGLGVLYRRARALRVTPDGEGVRVDTDAGALRARKVALALGASDRLAWPAWAASLAASPSRAPVQHVFEPGFSRAAVAGSERVLVVGGGITAVQVVSALAEQGVSRVVWSSRHELRLHTFDSDPGWMGPKYMTAFARDPDPTSRRRRIARARHRGSVSQGAWRRLQRSVRGGRVEVWHGEVRRAALAGEGVGVQHDAGMEVFDRVVLATGFSSGRPGGKLVEGLISAEGLPTAPRAIAWQSKVEP